MDLFAGVMPFVHVGEERSFRRAAERLGVSTAAVSKAIARLEGELGVTLLNRTTRQVSLTAEGALFLARCREAVVQLQAGRELLAQSLEVPHGTLRVSMPMILGRLVVGELARLSLRHPRLALHVSFTDRYSRLVEEEIDVAVRIGELDDSSLVARPLRTPRWVTVASPAYLARAGTPAAVRDLAGHACLKFLTPRGTPREWTFEEAGTAKTVKTPANVLFDHGELLVEAAASGAGIVQALDFMVREPLADGRLVEILAPYAAAGPPVHALCLPRRQNTPKVRALLDLLARVLGRAGNAAHAGGTAKSPPRG